MCNQAVSLISAELERRGISTVCIMLLREIAERIHPPRALCVPYPHGYPLGAPHDAAIQKRVMRAAFELLALDGPGPLLRDYAG
jgi:D-proline reductase (dithiol) PrdB